MKKKQAKKLIKAISKTNFFLMKISDNMIRESGRPVKFERFTPLEDFFGSGVCSTGKQPSKDDDNNG